MSQIRFRVSDAADIRFGISPLWETVRSLYALGDAGRHAVHLPWIRAARRLADEPRVAESLRLLGGFARPGGWLPDFLTPPPAGPLAELEDELATVRATPPGVVVADLRAIAVRRPLGPPARAVLDDPAGGLDALADAVRTWHAAAIAPHWSRLRAVLEADIGYRSRQLAEGGVRRLVDTLHPTVRWSGDRIVADDPWDLDLDLCGRGLPMMPSIFVDRRVLWNVRPDSPPVAVYPARAVAALWEAGAAGDSASAGLDRLAGVLGASRARLLAMTRAPASTAELARRIGLSPAAVSQHLAALRAAGLVSRAPHGRTVLYLATGPAVGLLRANGLADPFDQARVPSTSR